MRFSACHSPGAVVFTKLLFIASICALRGIICRFENPYFLVSLMEVDFIRTYEIR
jgi:hypothetical protein